MTDDDKTDAIAAPYLAAARRADSALPAGLRARILADAAAVREARHRPRSAPQPPIWRQLLGIIGGVPALGGLAAACAAGIWLGVAPPRALDPLTLVGAGMTVYSASALQDAILSEEGL